MTSKVPLVEEELLQDTQVALRQGPQLLSWWKEQQARLSLFSLLRARGEGISVQGFFETVEIDGVERTAMGCLQRASFQLAGHSALGRPQTFCTLLKRHFCQKATWTRNNKVPGGFGYRALAAQKKGERAGFFRPPPAAIDLNEVGTVHEWLLLQVDIHDFARSFPPLRPFAAWLHPWIKEAAFIVSSPPYETRVLPGSASSLAECRFGYAFVPALVEPNHFGFGPGRFGVAIKQFDFRLSAERRLDVYVSFLVAPRSQQVFDFRGFCPVYGVSDFLDRATRGRLGIGRRVHDRLDRQMLSQHGRVHNNLLQDMREAFDSWPA